MRWSVLAAAILLFAACDRDEKKAEEPTEAPPAEVAEYQWPDAPPPWPEACPARCYREMEWGDVPYRSVEVEPGRWRWVVDDKLIADRQAAAKREARRKELWEALNTRALTADELDEVIEFGDDIVTRTTAAWTFQATHNVMFSNNYFYSCPSATCDIPVGTTWGTTERSPLLNAYARQQLLQLRALAKSNEEAHIIMFRDQIGRDGRP